MYHFFVFLSSKKTKYSHTVRFVQHGKIQSSNRATYELLKKAEMKKADSYIQSCALSVLKNAKRAKSKNEFCELMGKDGFKTDWIETRKNVVFTDTKRKEAGESKCKEGFQGFLTITTLKHSTRRL